MKVLILLAVVALSQATSIVYRYPVPYHGLTSAFQSQDAAGNYAFGYQAAKPNVATFHHEKGSGGAKVGSYGMTSADGKVRVVDYVADTRGFRADIKTNEKKADDAKNPADVTINEAELKTVPIVSYLPQHAYGYAVAAPTYQYIVY